MGILQMQENNRLEILKRRWWEGGQCPREEDHRAKGQSLLSPVPLSHPSLIPPLPVGSSLSPNSLANG